MTEAQIIDMLLESTGRREAVIRRHYATGIETLHRLLDERYLKDYSDEEKKEFCKRTAEKVWKGCIENILKDMAAYDN